MRPSDEELYRRDLEDDLSRARQRLMWKERADSDGRVADRDVWLSSLSRLREQVSSLECELEALSR